MRWLDSKREQNKGQEANRRPRWFSTSAVREALLRGGCPVCVAASHAERRGMRAFLYEGMMSPDVRHDFLEGGGFCLRHFAMAVEIEDECWPAGGFGMAILCEDTLRKAQAAVERIQPSKNGRRRSVTTFEPGSACFFCSENGRKEQALVEVLEELSDEDEFAGPLKAGRLCLGHVQLALNTWKDSAKHEWLAAALRERSAALTADLREFIRKHDYQFRDEPKGREQDSVRRSAEFLFGSRYARKKVRP